MKDQKTFDELLPDFREIQSNEQLKHLVKVAMVKALAPNFLCTIQELANSYHWQELDESELCDHVEELINTTFNIGPDVLEAIDREFGFEDWLATAEGPPSPNQIAFMGRENTEE
mgnify:FL=1